MDRLVVAPGEVFELAGGAVPVAYDCHGLAA